MEHINPHTTTARQQAEYDNQKKSEGVAYALWFFFGALGGHRFYTRDTGIALGMLFTLGGLGFWALIDVFFIGRRVKQYNQDVARNVFGA